MHRLKVVKVNTGQEAETVGISENDIIESFNDYYN